MFQRDSMGKKICVLKSSKIHIKFLQSKEALNKDLTGLVRETNCLDSVCPHHTDAGISSQVVKNRMQYDRLRNLLCTGTRCLKRVYSIKPPLYYKMFEKPPLYD